MLLTELLGREVLVGTRRHAIADVDLGAVTTYRDDEGGLVVIGLFDLDAVLILGAALTLVPKGTLNDARKQGEVPEMVLENFWEVANIIAATLNRVSTRHMRLTDRARTLAEVDPDVGAGIAEPFRTRLVDRMDQDRPYRARGHRLAEGREVLLGVGRGAPHPRRLVEDLDRFGAALDSAFDRLVEASGGGRRGRRSAWAGIISTPSVAYAG